MSDHLGRLESWAGAGWHGAGQSNVAHRDDVLLLLEECRRLRSDVAALEGLFRDLQADDAGGRFAAGVAHGAARQLAEWVGRLTERAAARRETSREPGRTYSAKDARHEAEYLEAMVRELHALGPVRPPLPVERVAEENAKMRALLEDLATGSVRGYHTAELRARVLLGLPAIDADRINWPPPSDPAHVTGAG